MDENIDVTSIEEINLKKGYVSEKNITRYHRAPVEGFPYQALRVVRNSPKKLQLMFVIKIKNANNMTADSRYSFRASLVCNANTSNSHRQHLKKVRSVTVRLENKLTRSDGFIHLPVDISGLSGCDTLDQENLVVSTALSVPQGSKAEYVSFDWYIKKLKP
jgi:hypothetical protein